MIGFIAFLIGIVSIVLVSLFISVDWTTHLEMVKSHCSSYAWGTFTQFEREYAKRSWKQEEDFPQSHFGPYVGSECKNEIHADIIKFDDVGMLLGPRDYFLFKQWEKRHVYKAPSKMKPGHWEKE